MEKLTSSLTKKILVLVLLMSVCFGIDSAPRAQAFWPTWDASNMVQNTVTAISTPVSATATTIGTAWDTLGEHVLNALAYQAGQMALNQLTESTINWIKGGFHGSPSFSVDLNEIALDLADSVAGEIVLQLKGVTMCNFSATYKDDLINTIELSKEKNRDYRFGQKTKCPFPETVGFTAQGFYDDFSSGGWAAFGAALNDGGNPYGVQIVTENERAKRLEDATAKSDKKLSWSSGFTDLVDTTSCNYPPALLEAMGKQEIPPEAVKSYQKAYCKTTTPGKIVGDQLTKTLGVDIDKLGFSDNMDKIVSAFITQITQDAVRGVFSN